MLLSTKIIAGVASGIAGVAVVSTVVTLSIVLPHNNNKALYYNPGDSSDSSDIASGSESYVPTGPSHKWSSSESSQGFHQPESSSEPYTPTGPSHKWSSSESSQGSYQPESSSEPYTPGPITNDLYMTNEMDTFEILSSTKFSGVKPDEWEMNYTKYPYWQCGSEFTTEERNQIIAENKAYMNNLLKYARDGTLKRMPTSLGGDQQFEASGVDWNADRLKVRYGLFGQVLGQRAVAWAFPGEVVTVEFPEGMNYNGIMLSIGKCNHKPESQWMTAEKWSNSRMPIDSIGFSLSNKANKEYIINNTVKIGSPFGGMIYLRVDTAFTNAVYINFTNVGRAPIIVYNRTTNEEWNNELKNAPGNVAEIRTPGNRFVLTSRNIRGLEDAQFIADYWLKAISISDSAVGVGGMPITMNYDDRVDAGAAVSYVGFWYTQHPSDWAGNCINKNGLINSGAWGSLHEMNHQMQGWSNTGGEWGMGDPTEETNNALTAMNYMLYTNIAGHRHNGLSGWNYVSDGYSTIKPIFNKNYDQKHLRSYVNLAHAFGTDAFVDLVHAYYGAWFDNKYTYTYSIARNSDSAFCLLAAGVIKRDTRYLCKLFNYNVQANVLEAIENMNYTTYYPFFNLYAKSYNGNVYGRPYTLPMGTNRLDFSATTAIDPAATNVTYTITSGLTKGKLVEVEDGVYDYTPEFGVNDSDSFVLSIDCMVNGSQVHIEQEGTFLVNPNIVRYDAYRNINTKDLDTSIKLIENITANDTGLTSTIFGIPKYNDGSIISMFVERGKFVVPKTGYYTLFMKADDKGKLLVNLDGEYKQLLRIDTYTGSYVRTRTGGFYTLELEGGKEYPFILYNLNTGGQGFIQIGYCYHGTSKAEVNVGACAIKDFGSSMILHEDATAGLTAPEFIVPEIHHRRPTRFLTNSYRVVPSCTNAETCFVKCLEVPPAESSEPGGQCIDMLDGTTSTYHHSSKTNATEFPITYSFAFDENITFNNLYIHHRQAIDSWGYFEIYARSLETGEMVMAKNFHHPAQVATDITLPKLVHTDRVDFKVYNNSIMFLNYVTTAEIVFNLKADSFTNYTNSYGPDIKSDGFKKVITAGASGGNLMVNENEGEGSICFKIRAKVFGLYGVRKPTSGRFRITIDGKKVDAASQSHSSYTERMLFYIHDFSEDEAEKVHDVCMEVVDGTVNLDIIGWA